MADHTQAARKAAEAASFDWQDLGFRDRLAFIDFYAIAFKAGMERAAEICDKRGGQFFDESPFAVECHQLADSIRAHAQNQPKPTHDSSVV
jgi:hypothetical protein